MQYIVTGKTYQHQRAIKNLGGQWDGVRRGYIVDAKAAEWLSTASNFGRRAIERGTGLVIRPLTVAPVTTACPRCNTYCHGDCVSAAKGL